jgi:hypothetical protein
MISIGVDLEKMRDHSAIAVVRSPDTTETTARLSPWQVIERRRTDPSALVYVEKIPLGTPYIRVVERVQQVAQHPEMGGERRVVVVDATGVGMPVVEMLRGARLGCELRAVTITGGVGERNSGGIYSVSKTDLMLGLRTRMEQGWVEVARRLPEWAELRKQMLGFGGAGADDLVLAFALAVWGVKERMVGARNPTTC